MYCQNKSELKLYYRLKLKINFNSVISIQQDIGICINSKLFLMIYIDDKWDFTQKKYSFIILIHIIILLIEKKYTFNKLTVWT